MFSGKLNIFRKTSEGLGEKITYSCEKRGCRKDVAVDCEGDLDAHFDDRYATLTTLMKSVDAQLVNTLGVDVEGQIPRFL